MRRLLIALAFAALAYAPPAPAAEPAKTNADDIATLRADAEKGNADAQHNLGSAYANGQGLVKDEAEAVQWYRKAADQGKVRSQFNLGWMYAKGQGVAKDEAEAVKWYRKAAEQGDPPAQVNLGSAYANGEAWWTGLISQLGILGWTSAAASAAWAAWIARHTGRISAARFLSRGVVASIVLLVDDLIGVHSMFWALGPLGKPFGLAIVLSPVAAWFWVYRSDIRRTRWVLLVGAFVANALSVVADTLGRGSVSDQAALLEDGPKFLGILAWATYFIASTYDIARSALRSATLGARHR